jgi:hypothetical protein
VSVRERRPLVFATRNRGKLVELHELLAGLDVEVVGVIEAQRMLGKDIPDVVEDAETFLGNAAKKAREVALLTGWPSLADDSGLEVDALDGQPGVYSARWAGQHGDDAANNAKLMPASAARWCSPIPPARSATSSSPATAWSRASSSTRRAAAAASATTRCSSVRKSDRPSPRPAWDPRATSRTARAPWPPWHRACAAISRVSPACAAAHFPVSLHGSRKRVIGV